MKFFRNTIYTLIIAMTLLLVSHAHAAISPHINFMGKVTNTDGTELTDGTYNMSFSLYNTRTGGSSLWSENLTAANRFSGTISNVTTTNAGIVYTYSSPTASSTVRVGQYLVNATTDENVLIIDYGTSTVIVASSSDAWSVGENINNRPFVEGGVINENLGSVADITGVDFNQPLYLEINFNGELMEPRKLLASVPYAFEASSLDGKSGEEFAGLPDDEIVTGEWSFNNIVTISTSSSNTALTITQNGSGNIVEFKRAATTSFAVLNDGSIQFGDAITGYTFPSSRTGAAAGYVLKVDAFGDMYWDTDFAGSGGGSGLWASSSDGNYIYQADTGDVVLIGNNSTSTSELGYIVEITGGSWLETVAISDQNEVRFYDADSSNYVALRASGTISSDFTLTLPDNTGISGQALVTDGNGNLSWDSPSGFTYVNPGTAGQLSYYKTSGSTLSATSSIFLSSDGKFGVGTSTTASLLTVGGTSGSQFLVNSSGQVIGGTWQGDILGAAYGGTGTTTSSWTGLPFVNSGVWSSTSTLSQVYGGTGFSSYSVGDLVYAGNNSNLAKLPIDSNGKILTVVNGLPAWTSTTSLGMDISEISGILPVNQGGTGQNFTGSTGFIYLDNGVASASTTIRDAYITDDLTVSGGTISSNNISGTLTTTNTLTIGDDGDNIIISASNWDVNASGQITAATDETINGIDINNGAITDVTGLTVNGNIIVSGFVDGVDISTASSTWDSKWGALVDMPLNQGYLYVGNSGNNPQATSSVFISAIGNVGVGSTSPKSLLSIGSNLNINTSGIMTGGTWNGNTIAVAYGGTGTSTFEANSILFAPSDDIISEILPGSNNQVLKIVSGIPTWGEDSTLGGESNLWATSSDDLLIHPSLAGYVVVIGATATTTAGYDLEVANDALIGGNLVAQDLSLTNPLGVASGGMGTSTFIANSLVFASSDNNIGQVLPGSNGYALVMSGGKPTWSSTTPGIAHDILSAQHNDTEATSTRLRGDLLAVGDTGNWTRLALGTNGYILQSNGTDAVWATTTNITSLGTVNFGTWNASVIDIAYGGTGAGTVAGARASLDLDEVYKFGINATGTSGYVWQSDGDGRGQWVATTSLGISSGGGAKSKFIGTTSDSYYPDFATTTYIGYKAANEICIDEYGSDAHFCRTYDIIVSIELDDISSWNGSAWVSEGPPGYTANSNDCQGWTASSSAMLGAYWQFESAGGGMGWLISCLTQMPIACCAWQ